jgi:hypothetical protein
MTVAKNQPIPDAPTTVDRPKDAPTILDSGERRQFEGGAVRDRGDFKPRPDLISPHVQMREGAILAAGAEKYDPRNWEEGMPISECIASCMRHLFKFMLGRTDEDHLAMARTNLGFAMHYEEEIKAGRLDPKWDDMPFYEQQDRRPCCGGVTPADFERLVNVTIEHAPECIRNVIAKRALLAGQPLTHDDIIIPRFDSVMTYGNDYVTGESVWRAYGSQEHWGIREWAFVCPYWIQMDHIPEAENGEKVYIAGPMRGYERYNFPTFDLARDIWRIRGWEVINPADLDRENDDFRETDVWPEVAADAEARRRAVVQRDADAVIGLSPGRGDCLAMLPGWRRSTGALAEYALARFSNLPVVRAFDGEVVPVE